jgi:hypothetical protein
LARFLKRFYPVIILSEVYERGLLRDEQFGFRPKHSTSLQLARLVERVSRNFGEKRLTGAVFPDVAKAFVTVWVDGLAYKVIALKFPSYLVEPFNHTCEVGRLKRPSKQSSIPAVACGLAWHRRH